VPGTQRAEAEAGRAIRAVLFDVGGTLWPDRPSAPRVLGGGAPEPGTDPLVAAAAARVSALVGLGAEEALVLAARLADDRGAYRGDVQDTAGHVARAVRALGADGRGLDLGALQRVMCLPAAQVLRPFAGARDVLGTARELGLAVAVVSNALWRDGEAYRRDFTDLGLATYVDAYVSSVDVGYRKPHPAMFRAALDALDVAPAVAAMVGNSVANDVIPAQALGMRTVLVAIEEAPPLRSAADAVCTSLAEVGNWLRGAAGGRTGR
jgi:HAD superfamily hydrolase (TIGR01509 family)